MRSRVTYRTARQSAKVLSTGQPSHGQQCRHEISYRSHFGDRSKSVLGQNFDVMSSIYDRFTILPSHKYRPRFRSVGTTVGDTQAGYLQDMSILLMSEATSFW